MAGRTVYHEDGDFIIFRRNNKRKLTVWNRKKPFENDETGEKGHGHIKRIQTGKDAIIAVKYNKLVRDSNPRFLELCARLSTDPHYHKKCLQLAATKRKKGKKRYIRKPKHFLKGY